MTQVMEPNIELPPLPLPQIASEPRSAPRSVPGSARTAGFLALLFGLLLGGAGGRLIGPALRSLFSTVAPANVRYLIVGVAGAFALVSVLLALGGLLLACGRLIGRTTLLTFSWITLPLMAAAVIVAANAVDFAGSSAGELIPLFWFTAAAGGACILFSIVLGWLLLTGAAAQWRDAARPRRSPTGLPDFQPRMSIAALLSLIFSFLPPFGLMQLIALIMGVKSLGTIRRSNGMRYGRGLAIAGTIISLTVFVAAAGLCGVISGSIVMDASRREVQAGMIARLIELDAAQHVFHQSHRGEPASSIKTVSNLLIATAPFHPLDPEIARLISLADFDAHGSDARPYRGYLFGVSLCPDAARDDPAKDAVILAWPAKGDGKSLMLRSDGQFTVFDHPTGQPPATLSQSQIDAWETTKSDFAR